MTTAAAAARYLADHMSEWRGKGYAIFNPLSRPVEDLPVIYGFNNGGGDGWFNGCLIAEDGTGLGGHVCSDVGYMYSDLGILEGSAPHRHETFQQHFPEGYRMDFVPMSEVRTHAGLLSAYQRNQQKAAEAKSQSEPA